VPRCCTAPTLGGAVNLVTRKPVKPFEGDVRLGVGSGGERRASFNLGGNQGNWYYQLGASYLDADSFPLPRGFRDYKKQPTDTGSKRENADRTDKRLSFKLGLTPNATDEYAIGYVRQEGEKGNPVYTGQSTQKNAVRYWRWPYWDKDSLYFLSTTRLNGSNVLKTRLYHDTYKNGLDMYKDASYTAHDPTSSYKDVSRGPAWSGSTTPSPVMSCMRPSTTSRTSTPTRPRARTRRKHYRDVTTSLVLEDHIALAERWRLTLGLSHDQRDARQVYQWPTGSTSATNGLARLSYALTAQGDEVYLIASHKSRATIKDRYSARMGTALANPDLKPEVASHLELGLSGKPWQGGKGQAAVFYSRVRDQIQTMVVDSTACGGKTCNQAQNVGRTRNVGFEVSLAQQLSAQWAVHAGYTYLSRTNLSDRSITLTDTPRQRLTAALQWSPQAQWQLRAELEAEQGPRCRCRPAARPRSIRWPATAWPICGRACRVRTPRWTSAWPIWATSGISWPTVCPCRAQLVCKSGLPVLKAMQNLLRHRWQGVTGCGVWLPWAWPAARPWRRGTTRFGQRHTGGGRGRAGAACGRAWPSRPAALSMPVTTVAAAPKEGVVPAFARGQAQMLLIHASDEAMALEASGMAPPRASGAGTRHVMPAPLAAPPACVRFADGTQALRRIAETGSPFIALRSQAAIPWCSVVAARRHTPRCALAARRHRPATTGRAGPGGARAGLCRGQPYSLAFGKMSAPGIELLLHGDPLMRSPMCCSRPARAIRRCGGAGGEPCWPSTCCLRPASMRWKRPAARGPWVFARDSVPAGMSAGVDGQT
jgi:iron complex outermembrane receptor protein